MNQFPLWSKYRRWAEGLRAPRPPPPVNPPQDAVQRWENEGGNAPRTEPPGDAPRKHL